MTTLEGLLEKHTTILASLVKDMETLNESQKVLADENRLLTATVIMLMQRLKISKEEADKMFDRASDYVVEVQKAKAVTEGIMNQLKETQHES